MLTRYRLPLQDLDELAAGAGSPATIAALRSTQHSRRLILLRALLDAAEQCSHKDLLAGFELLCQAEHHDPAAAAEALGYPFAGSWAAHCLRRLTGADPGDGSVATDLSHLGGIAAVAAIRARVPFSIDVPVRGDAAYLPSLGRLTAVNGPAVTVHSDGHQPMAAGRPLFTAPTWQPVHRMTLAAEGQSLSIALDDIDPFRGGPRLPLAPRLSAVAVRDWARALGQAWTVLARHHGDDARGLAAGLVAIVPMVTQPGRGVNATHRESFGAAAMSAVSDPVALAVGLLHEFQHGKLNAILDLAQLLTPDAGRYYAAWRQDPRPLSGLLHGAYAYVGVCDFWRVQAGLPGTPHRAYAQMELARWSGSTGRALAVLLGSGRLTRAGERFVLGLRARADSWQAQEMPQEVTRLAWLAATDHRVSWRLRNLRPRAEAVDALARAWLAGQPVPVAVAQATPDLRDGGVALGASSRLDLINLRLREPSRLAMMARRGDADPADADLVSGNRAQAATTYLDRIGPDDADGWAGLALALGETIPALRHAPELVRALYARLLELSGAAPDPRQLASWLSPAAPMDPVQASGPESPSPSQ